MLGLKLPWEIVAVLIDKKVAPDFLLCPHAASATERVSTTTIGRRTMHSMSCADLTGYWLQVPSMAPRMFIQLLDEDVRRTSESMFWSYELNLVVNNGNLLMR